MTTKTAKTESRTKGLYSTLTITVYSCFEKGCRMKVSSIQVWVFIGILHIGVEQIYKFVPLYVKYPQGYITLSTHTTIFL